MTWLAQNLEVGENVRLTTHDGTTITLPAGDALDIDDFGNMQVTRLAIYSKTLTIDEASIPHHAIVEVSRHDSEEA